MHNESAAITDICIEGSDAAVLNTHCLVCGRLVTLEVSSSPFAETRRETTHHLVWPEVSGGSLSLHSKISTLILTEV